MISFKVAAKLVQKLEFLRILQRYTKKWITSFILWGFRFHLMMFFKIYSNWCRKPYPTWICNQKKQLFSADMTATNTTKIKAWRRWVGHVERGLDDDRCLRCQLCGDRHDFSCTEDVEENMYRIECWNEYIYIYIYLVTKIFFDTLLHVSSICTWWHVFAAAIELHVITYCVYSAFESGSLLHQILYHHGDLSSSSKYFSRQIWRASFPCFQGWCRRSESVRINNI